MVVATSPDSASTKQYKTLEHCCHWASGMPLFQRIRFESANLRILGWNAQTSKSCNPSKLLNVSLCFKNHFESLDEFGATWCSGGAMFQLIVWSGVLSIRPLLAMHALAKQLQPRMCYTLIHLDSLNKWGWQRLWTKPTNDASEISEWVTVTVLQYSLYLLLQLINEKGLWNMKPLQEFLLQCSETYWMHQIQPIWWLGAIKLNAMDWKAVHENNMKTVCKKSSIVEPSGCSR